jgi:hypothetical protein
MGIPQIPRTLRSALLFSAVPLFIGCGEARDTARPPGSFRKIVLDHGAPLFGTIVRQSDTTLTLATADSRDTVIIERARVTQAIDLQPRQQILATQLSWNPSLYYYRSIIAPLDVGLTAGYLWKGLWMGEIRAVELGGELRVLPFGHDLRGFYLSAYLNYAIVVANRSDHSFTQWWSNGWLVGWQWFPLYNIAAGICAGAESWHFPGAGSVGSELGYSGTPIARFQIGYAW